MKYEIGEMVEVCFKGTITEAKQTDNGLVYVIDDRERRIYATVKEDQLFPVEVPYEDR